MSDWFILKNHVNGCSRRRPKSVRPGVGSRNLEVPAIHGAPPTMGQWHSENTSSKTRPQFPATCSSVFSVFLLISLLVFSSPIKLSSCFMNACKHLIATVPCSKNFQSLTVPCVNNSLLGRVGSGEGHGVWAEHRCFICFASSGNVKS